jgi:coenzyme F420-reducing hydrogenase delta subunit
MGQIGASIILKAFERGADGVMLVACAPDECHYEFGSRRAAELFEEVRKLGGLLGLGEDRLQLVQVGTGESASLVGKVRHFVEQLATVQEEPVRWEHPRAIREGADGS